MSIAARSVTDELILTRDIAAPRARVFAAWTDARAASRWWVPQDCTPLSCELDVRPGGAWRAHGYKPGGEHFAKSGIYLEVKRPELLVFTWAHHAEDNYVSLRGHETTVRVEFRAIGNKTEITLVQGPFIDTPNYNGHNTGWQGSFDKLTAFLGSAS